MNKINKTIKEMDNLSLTQMQNRLKNKKKDSIDNIIKAIELNIDKTIIINALKQIRDE